jgi:hypothetical protein
MKAATNCKKSLSGGVMSRRTGFLQRVEGLSVSGALTEAFDGRIS